MNITTLIDSLHQATSQHHNKTALRFINFNNKPFQELTYLELWQQTENMANHLQQMVKPGDRVLLVFEPGLNIIPCILACFYVGAIAIPTYPPKPQQLRTGLQRLQSLITDASPSCIICSSLANKILKAENIAASINNMVRFAKKDKINTLNLKEINTLIADKLLTEKGKILTPNTSEKIALLQYSSGSTGKPKGVVVTHENVLHACRLMQMVFRTSSDSTMV